MKHLSLSSTTGPIRTQTFNLENKVALNLSKLFDRDVKPSYIKNLAPHSKEEASLREAKTQIQKYLQTAIPKWLEEKLGEKTNVRPKFRTQGSWAYKTCNEPCQHPPQEMDWDLGIYLPVSLWDDYGIHPKAAAKGYYDMVRELMTPLAKENNWTLSEKPMCARVKLNNNTRAHIDLPLYAAPDEEFIHVKEAREALAKTMAADSSFSETTTWDSLTRISLACKDGTWNPSDPGRVVVWFEKKLQRHGPQLRRISRYLKAWRDHTWASGGPSSIVLMVCAAKTMDQTNADFSGRDDLALAHVLQALSSQLINSVREPMIDPDEDLNRLDVQARQEAAVKVAEFHSALRQALDSNIANRNGAIQLIQKHLGQRFPNDPDGVTPDDGPTNIRNIPAEPRPRSPIVSTTAG